MPGPASTTRAGISTSPESTGTSRPSPTTGLTSLAGAIPAGAIAPRSGSGITDRLPGTAAAPHRAGTGSRHPGRDRRLATDTAVRGPGIATTRRPRRHSPARRPAGPAMSTRRTRPRCGGPAQAAVVTPARSSPASSRHPVRAAGRRPTSGARLRPTPADPVAPGFGLARRRPRQAGFRHFRPCHLRQADPVQAQAARSSPAGNALAENGLTGGGQARPVPVRFPRRPAGADLLVLARCRPVPSHRVRPSPVPGGPPRPASGSRRRSSGPAESWRPAPSSPG
jgi:hypothetical protein